MIRLVAKIIYLIVGIGMAMGLIRISWLRESSNLLLTPEILFAIGAVVLAYYVIGCNLWEEKIGRAYLHPKRDSWLNLEQQAQADNDAGRVYRYKNMDEAIKSLVGNDKDD